MSAETELARQWLTKAQSDLLNADNNLNAEQVPLDTVCFHCQQAAEKMLKAFLVGNGHPHPFTHDLLLLLQHLLPIHANAEQLRDALSLLMPYAVEIRYPSDAFTPTEEDAWEARQAAEEVLTWLRAALPEIF